MSKIKTIVHVEDDLDVIEMLHALFEDCPIHWVNALTGAEGLRLIRKLHPDLVILDLMLPDMAGNDFFLQLQADPELRDIAVWVLTVIWWKANRYPWHESSVVSYTFKPFEPYELRDGILQVLGMQSP